MYINKVILSIVINRRKFVLKISINLNDVFKNIRENFLFFSSAISFLLLNMRPYRENIIGIIIGVIALIITAVMCKIERKKIDNIAINIISLVTAFGICYFVASYAINKIAGDGLQYFLNNHTGDGIFFSLGEYSDLIQKIAYIGIILLAICSFYSVYALLTIFYNHLLSLNLRLTNDMPKYEKIFYIVIIATCCVYSVFTMYKSKVFFGDAKGYGCIYTSDTNIIASENAYMSLR